MSLPLIDIHTHKNEAHVIALRSIRLGVEPLPQVDTFFSAGIHPWDCTAVAPEYIEILESLPLAAVGEIGLDYAIATDRATQQHYFIRQADIAQQLGIPMVIHCVKAYNDLFTLLHSYSTATIFHGFTGSEQLTDQALQAGAYLSFGKAVFHSHKAMTSLRCTPSDRLFLETDTSETPIRTIYEQAAALRQTTLEDLIASTYTNYQTLFNR